MDEPNPPDYLLIFAWSFFDEIAERCARYVKAGGRLIVPLPEVRIWPPESSLLRNDKLHSRYNDQ